MKLRIATFNCENLLSRAALLNLTDNSQAKPLLEQLTQLQDLLNQPNYSDAAKTSILSLLNALKDYIELRELRRKLLGRKNKVTIVRASGRGDWEGGIDLKRDPLPAAARKSTARVIQAVDADVLCLVEVEDRAILERFNHDLLGSAYSYNMLIDGNDDRGIDVGIFSRHTLRNLRSHIFDATPSDPKRRIFSRDCLEVEVELPDGRSLWMLLNHFKSNGYGKPAQNDARRRAQASRVAEILAGYDLTKDFVVTAGDFNDVPESPALQPLLSVPHLRDVLPWRFPDPTDRWTYRSKKQIDYLLVSDPLYQAIEDVGIERRGLFDAKKLTKGAVEAFDTVTDDLTDASDHCAVWAEFGL